MLNGIAYRVSIELINTIEIDSIMYAVATLVEPKPVRLTPAASKKAITGGSITLYNTILYEQK